MKRTIAIGVLLLFSILTSAYLFHLRNENRSYERLSEYNDKVAQTWRNEDSLSRARIESLQAQIRGKETSYTAWIDSLSESLDIKTKHLQSALSVGMRQDRIIRIPVTVRQSDSSSVYDGQVIGEGQTIQHFEFQDQWTAIGGDIVNGQLTLRPQYRDSLGFVTHLHRKGWFGKRVLTADIISYNPYTTFTGMQHYQKDIPPRRWGLGVFFGYDLINRTPSAGVAINWDLIQF